MALLNYFTTNNPIASQPVTGTGQAAPTRLSPVHQQQITQTNTPTPLMRSGSSMVQGNLEALLNPNSSYIQNARQRGLETAAVRGGINSSIAAGSAERAAIEAAAPLAQQATDIDKMSNTAQFDNWLSQQNFGRALYGQQFSNSLDMLNNLQQAAIDDPELYTPEVTSGFSNFFQQNMSDIMKRYFGGSGT